MWLENLLVGAAAAFALILIAVILLKEQKDKWKDWQDRNGDK